MRLLIEATFWVCAGGVLYIYAGYPLLVWLSARLVPHPVAKAPFVGQVSVVISVRNEAPLICSKMEQLLASPDAALVAEVLVGSDGSTDGTGARLRAISDPRVKVVEFAERRGKPSVLNDLIPQCTHDIVVLMDARQTLAPGALGRLLEGFADERVGVISGELVFSDGEGAAAAGIGFYWNYEKFIRRNEALFRSVPGATGAFYAIRKRLFRPIPGDALLDDVAIPMQAVEAGYRCVFEPRAVVYDQPSESAEKEGIRKRRTIAGNGQLIRLYPRWLLPWRNPIWLELVSHKMLRLLSPLLLGGAFLANALVMGQGLYRGLLGCQMSFYAVAFLGWVGARRGWRVRVPAAAYMFVALNVTTAMALVDALRGRYRVQWQKAA